MDGNVGGWKNVGGTGANPMPTGAAPFAIGWVPMPAAGDAAALQASAADESS